MREWIHITLVLVVGMLMLASCDRPEPGAAAKGEPETNQPATTQPVTSQAGTSASVSIDNFTFEPRELNVAPGTTIVWTNKDDVPHTVTSTDKRFKSSGALDTDDTFSLTFDKPGNFPYYCAVHPHMTGSIVVKEK